MASVSKTDILNATLRQLGAKRISSIDDNQPRAKTLKDLYDIIRRELLEDARPSFARERLTLTRKATAPSFGYTYEYELPGDFLIAVEENSKFKYVIEGNGVLSNEESVELIYILDLEDTSLFSASFIEAFYKRMAMEGAYDITGSKSYRQELRQEYNFALMKASGSDAAQDDFREGMEPNSFIDARGNAFNPVRGY